MVDNSQNMVCDIEIKEEFLGDFSEITNHNFQIDQEEDNVTNEIYNNFVQCEKGPYHQTICSIKVENDNLCNEIEVEQGKFGIKQLKLDENMAKKDIKSEKNVDETISKTFQMGYNGTKHHYVNIVTSYSVVLITMRKNVK